MAEASGVGTLHLAAASGERQRSDYRGRNGRDATGAGLLMKFGFIAGCVMVMAGFMAAKRDENWKMTVIYGLGVAGAVQIMSALYNYFGASGASIKPSW
jgi:hypothetical protein